MPKVVVYNVVITQTFDPDSLYCHPGESLCSTKEGFLYCMGGFSSNDGGYHKYFGEIASALWRDSYHYHCGYYPHSYSLEGVEVVTQPSA